MASQLRKKSAFKKTGFLKELQKRNPVAYQNREVRLKGKKRVQQK